MVLVNVSIYDKCCSKIILAWTISEIPNDEVSIKEFFQHLLCEDDYDLEGHELCEARVGRGIDSLFPVKKLGKC